MDENDRASFTQNDYQNHNSNLMHTIKSLEEEIESTIFNYEQILQNEKKTSADRSEFLLYLIQSLRTRHLQQIQTINSQLQQAEGEREQANTMQKQMENIGEGLDQIVEQSRRLKATNENLQKQLQEQEQRDKELDEQIKQSEKELNDFRLKVDEWQRVKIKWNRQKKQLLQMIEDAQNAVVSPDSDDQNICEETGEEVENCEHCHNKKIEHLYNKYMVNGAS